MSTESDFPTLSAGNTAGASTGSTAQATTGTATNTATGTQTATQTGSTDTASAITSGSSASVITNAPNLSSTSISLITGAPTLSGYYSYPAPTVPPTNNAPYMQATNLPQNFVFIVVGAVIAFLAFCLIAWRFLAAWSINRNIKREGTTAAYTPLYDQKTKSAKHESNHDLADLSALPKSFGNSVPSLFFSPTAEVARHSMPRTQINHQHLPGGHYRDVSK